MALPTLEKLAEIKALLAKVSQKVSINNEIVATHPGHDSHLVAFLDRHHMHLVGEDALVAAEVFGVPAGDQAGAPCLSMLRAEWNDHLAKLRAAGLEVSITEA